MGGILHVGDILAHSRGEKRSRRVLTADHRASMERAAVLPQHRLEVGEDLLDGVEVRVIWREVEVSSAGPVDGMSDCLAFVRTEVGDDDQAACAQVGTRICWT